MSSMIQAYLDRHAVGFGDIAFAVGGNAQWTKTPTIVQTRIPGGNVTVTQFMGNGPDTVTYDLILATVDSYQLLKDAVGTSGTLTLLPDIAAVTRTSIVIAGERYDQIADTVLTEVTSPKLEAGGYVTCTATWTYQD